MAEKYTVFLSGLSLYPQYFPDGHPSSVDIYLSKEFLLNLCLDKTPEEVISKIVNSITDKDVCNFINNYGQPDYHGNNLFVDINNNSLYICFHCDNNKLANTMANTSN